MKGVLPLIAKDAAAIKDAAIQAATMGATAAADAAATVVVAKAKAKAWKLRFRGLACVLLTLWAHYFVLLPLLAAHPTFFIVLSVVPYVRTHPRKQRSTTHPALLLSCSPALLRPSSPPPPTPPGSTISAPSHQRAATACARRRPSCTPGPSTIS